MSTKPRVRISPSPTGYFHVGGARTALYNWLFARQHDGAFLLRIEDTDAERHVDTAVLGIQEALRWLGLDWDEDIVFQSDRQEKYGEAAAKLVADGVAYYCDCTKEAVDARAKAAGRQTPGYDGFCRDRQLGPGPGRALRFRTPDDGATTVADVIRGEPTFPNDAIEDFVIVRSDGSALFVLANVVDDIDMGITHVIRGDEHLPTTPKAILLWGALGGGDLPVYAHLPVLVNEQRQKLSKRKDHKVALEDYRAEGYLPEAMVNYLALLGWGPGDDREIMTVDELVRDFRLEDVNSSPAFFDEKKLQHFNAEYIRALTVEQFIGVSGPFLSAGAWAPGDFDFDAFDRIAPLVQERVRVLSEVPGMVEFLFVDDVEIDPAVAEKHFKPPAADVIDGVLAAYEAGPWEAAAIEEATWAVGERLGLNKRKTQFPIRVAVTGKDVGPPLFESLEVLGQARTLERLRAARRRLE